MENSPLKRLPAELRNYIYELVLVDRKEGAVTLHPDYDNDQEPRYECWNRKPLALTMVSKQIRNEAFPIFVSQNQFEFVSQCGTTYMLEKVPSMIRLWISYLGDFSRDLRQVKVNLGSYDGDSWEFEHFGHYLYGYLKDIKTAFRRLPNLELSMTLGLSWPSEKFPGYPHREGFQLELYPTNFERVKAELDHEFRKVYKHARGCRSYSFWDEDCKEDYDSMFEALKSLDEDPTWSWGRSSAPTLDLIGDTELEVTSPSSKYTEDECSCLRGSA